MLEEFKNQFLYVFGEPATFTIFAPGRVNIIGEHTDYNEGFVFPFAIHKGIWFLASTNDTNTIRIFGSNTNEQLEISLPDIDARESPGWYKFIYQVLKLYADKNIIGFNVLFGGNLPIGAGISSSSSLTCGFITLIDQINHFETTSDTQIQKAVIAERGYGVQGGIMDQFTIFNGRKNQAILLDCKSYHPEYIHIENSDYNFYLINSKVKHNLIDTDYNQRHHECTLAVNWINQNYKPIVSLRSITSDDLPDLINSLDTKSYQRTSFVVEENARVLKAKDALISGDYQQLGQLLFQSHAGLSLKYEVSCPELDWLVKYAKSKPCFMGARMMGGGFGGCTINLVKGKFENLDQAKLIMLFHEQFGIEPEIIPVRPSSGIIESLHNN